MYVYHKQLLQDDGTVLGTFSSHWAATAAMIRLKVPGFKSLAGDKPEDLAVESAMGSTPGASFRVC